MESPVNGLSGLQRPLVCSGLCPVEAAVSVSAAFLAASCASSSSAAAFRARSAKLQGPSFRMKAMASPAPQHGSRTLDAPQRAKQ